jgi:hypothetical protein
VSLTERVFVLVLGLWLTLLGMAGAAGAAEAWHRGVIPPGGSQTDFKECTSLGLAVLWEPCLRSRGYIHLEMKKGDQGQPEYNSDLNACQGIVDFHVANRGDQVAICMVARGWTIVRVIPAQVVTAPAPPASPTYAPPPPVYVQPPTVYVPAPIILPPRDAYGIPDFYGGGRGTTCTQGPGVGYGPSINCR